MHNCINMQVLISYLQCIHILSFFSSKALTLMFSHFGLLELEKTFKSRFQRSFSSDIQLAQGCWSFLWLTSATFLYGSFLELLFMYLFLSCWVLVSLKFLTVPHWRKKFCLNCLNAIPSCSFSPLSWPFAFEYGTILSTTEYQTDIGLQDLFSLGDASVQSVWSKPSLYSKRILHTVVETNS